MARINVDQQALGDARFARLAQLRGWADADHARGKMLHLWNECIHRGAVLEAWVVDHHLGAGAAGDLLESKLGELVNLAGTGLDNPAGGLAGGTLVRIKGTDGRTDYLHGKIKAAKLGGKARAASAARVGGRFTSKTDQPLAGDVAGSHTSALDLDLDLDLKKEGAAGAPPDSKSEKDAKRASKIPERAWKAADYLRDLVLAEDAAALVSKQPWGDGVQNGWRLAWADEIRLMVERDGRTYEQIADVLRYVFKEQTGSKKFIVQSGDALREKFDSIQAVRRNRSESDKPKQVPMRIPLAGSDRR